MPVTYMHWRVSGALLVLGWSSALHAAPKPAPSKPQPAAPKPAPSKSEAQIIKDKCIADADEGQSLRDGGKLLDARTRFVGCASSTCPGVVTKECSAWLADVEERLPTVVITARDGHDIDLVDVRVSVDGQPFLDKLTGTQVPIDPGPHDMRFEYSRGGEGPFVVDEKVVISERQKGRVLQVPFPNVNPRTEAMLPSPVPEPAPPPKTTRSAPVAAYVVGGAGLLALGSFAFFGIKGRSDYNDLKDTCEPNCNKSDADAVKTKFLVADISLGVGVAALGVATYLFLTHRSDEAPRVTTSQGRPHLIQHALGHTVVTPTRGGGWLAGYETRF
ncbi:hypothetical protein [Pendulispora albinea]|uniref:Lipoprotein n=1 Tax=Pendulispora albinea TaxID=2741071 RepID=A0ABZ2M5N9_9BACT